MSRIVKPTWEIFDRLVAEAKQDLVICAPWIAATGVRRLQHHLLSASPRTLLPRVQFWARVADINTDTPGILELVKKLEVAGGSTVVRDSPVLHAKIYLADSSMALVTSANLSEAGFAGNLEAGVVISDREGITEVVNLLGSIATETALVATSDLEYFVSEQWPLLMAQTPQNVAPTVVPVWRHPLKPSVRSAGEPVYEPLIKYSGRSREVPLLDAIKWVEASLQVAQGDMQDVDLNDWVGRKARIWVCPTYVIHGVSPYLSHLIALYSLGELEFGQRLVPERFTELDGSVESVLEHGRALFRQKRARKARIELTRYPDPGSANPLDNVDSRFLIKIQAVD